MSNKKKPKKAYEFVEGPAAKKNFEDAMKSIFRAPKKLPKGKD